MAVYTEQTLHTLARKQQDTRSLRGRMVCVAGAQVCACCLRVRGRQMRRRVLGHGGKCVRVSGGEKVAWKFLRACQRLLEDVQHIIKMSSSCRSCSQWFTRPKSWPMHMSSACGAVRG